MKYNVMNIMKGMKPESEVKEEMVAEADPGAEGSSESDPAGSAAMEAIDFEGLLRGDDKQLTELDLAMLDDNVNNHFSRMSGQQWEEFVGSIREYGILTPLIVRPMGTRYEIIAGHNRKYGALEAGLKTVPCTIVNVDDVDASVMIGITNNQREHVTDLEKGWAYRTTLEAIRHQGAALNASEQDEKTSRSERSVDIVARKYGVNRKTIQRKIRYTFLLPEMYAYGADEKFSQSMLLDLSYLKGQTQANVLEAAKAGAIRLTEEMTRRLRAEAENRELAAEEVIRICRAPSKAAAKKRPRSYKISDEMFPEGLTIKDRQKYVEAALAYVLARRIDPRVGSKTEETREGGRDE